MAEPKTFDPDLEWMDHVRPVGLVVAPLVLKRLEAIPERQSQTDNDAAKALLDLDPKSTRALPDPWPFFRDILGWDPSSIAGAPGGPELPQELARHYPEHDTTLAPDWAVADPQPAENRPQWQLLVRIEAPGVDPDKRAELRGWEATPHQRFERLLRDTDVFAGIMITDDVLRLVYAPRGETSGWLSFPLKALAGVSGRAMLGGLKLLLEKARLFTEQAARRLPALLKASRDAQAEVSTRLAGQVLGALYELLRGLNAADGTNVANLARERPAHLYEGLLTVLMRLVFALYAEDRDVIPSFQDARSRDFYAENYGVRGLYGRLSEDAALNPDTMDERYGAWGRLLALFRLIHAGEPHGFVQARGGKLFDPDVFPFLEGRAIAGDAPRVLKVGDGCVFRILDGLTTIAGDEARERLSYRSLDVEQIGSVYETIMGFEADLTAGTSLAIKAGKNNRTPVFVDLAALARLSPDGRLKHLKETSNRSGLPAGVMQAVKAASSVDELMRALEPIADERASPKRRPMAAGTPILQPTDERRRSGSHYTPRSLTEPIVRYALEPAFERLGERAKPQEILDLKVCDPAMGSGAFLVEACRQIATRLVKAWTDYPEQRPVIPPDEDEDLHARRLAAQRCIYGVDKNPMAADLARLSLWLATLARDHEFTFLDHALKSGDSLVGLTKAQIAAAHWDTSKPGLPLLRGMTTERVAAAVQGRNLIQTAPDNVTRADQEARHMTVERRLTEVRLTGDAIVAAFFAEEKPKAREARRATIESWFAGADRNLWAKLGGEVATLTRGEHPIRPFHWEIEFPEVFEGENGGFDVVVGNPPFLGGKRISVMAGEEYNQWLTTVSTSSNKNMDLSAHFFRQSFRHLRRGGAFGLIATNTIGQGATREGGLCQILADGGQIFSATRRLRWPGEAAVVVSIVHVAKESNRKAKLDGREVERISAYLVEGNLDLSPHRLAENARRAFIGSFVLGMGFTFDDDGSGSGVGQPSTLHQMAEVLSRTPASIDVIKPFIGGEEVNNSPTHVHDRYVIDFGGLSEAEASERFPDLFKIVRTKVKPARDVFPRDAYRRRWWRFAEESHGLYETISRLGRVMVVNCGATPHAAFAFLPKGIVYAHTLTVFAFSTFAPFAVLQSRLHDLWAWTFASSMKNDLRYTPSDVFETFAFPPEFENDPRLEAAGAAYCAHRAALMIENDEGLTKTYNRFHDPQDMTAGIVELRRLHDAMDQAVMTAYGWDDELKRCAVPEFEPLFDDDDDEEEAGGRRARRKFRYRWPEDVRDEVLALLLALNAARAAEERAADPAPKKTTKKRAKKAKSPAMPDLLGD